MSGAMRPYTLAASLICANMMHLEDEVSRLAKAEVDYIHFDVMDGLFVPRYGFHPEILQAVRQLTSTPVDVHMMVQNADPYIPLFAAAGANYFVVHAEAAPHLHQTIRMIKQAGMKAGVAINPATPLSVLDYLLDDIDLVCLMMINPGIVGHTLIPNMMQKIVYLKQKLGPREHIHIQVDGGVTPESAPRMLAAGATMLVCGTGTIFRPQEAPVDEKISELRSLLDGVTIPSELVMIPAPGSSLAKKITASKQAKGNV